MKMKMIKRIFSTFICFMLCFVIMTPVKAQNPRVMLTDYSVSSTDNNQIHPGEDFVLKLTYKNTASKTIKNLKISIYAENGEFVPKDSAGTAYISEIKSGETADISLSMTAISLLEEKSYKVISKLEYESSSGYEYSVDEQIFLPVILGTKATMTDLYLAEDVIELGDAVEVMGSVNNTGGGTLYNVNVFVEGDFVSDSKSYVGNIKTGESASFDVVAKTIGIVNNGTTYITITYEDAKGNEQRINDEFGVTITQPVYENLELIKDTTNNSGVIQLIVYLVVLFIAILAVIIFMNRRQKKKKLLEDYE